MHILVIDGGHVEVEFREKFGPGHEYSFLSTTYSEVEEWQKLVQQIADEKLVSDVAFVFGKTERFVSSLALLNGVQFSIFTDILNQSLAEDYLQTDGFTPVGALIGFCGLPTLLNRPLLEVSLYHEADRQKLAETCAALGTDYRVVADRVGLVTPRVICQIINEAYFTVQEGTASKADVDLGMKLGTSYPRGPFAWANAIGVERVYAVLEALWQDTHDERYKVCPLLKRQALRGEPFAV